MSQSQCNLQSDLRLDVLPVVYDGVQLRIVTPDDVQDFLRLLRSPGVYEGLASVPRSPDLEFAKTRINQVCENIATGNGLQLIGQSEGEVVGTIGVYINWKHRHGGLGYHLDTPARGKDIASRMLQGLLNHCFDQIGLHRIWAETFVDNESSRRLLVRNGFSFEGVKRQTYLKEDRYLDVEMWAMLATDPRPWKEQTS